MKILIPLDGSKFAEEALTLPKELLGSPGNDVHLLRVVISPSSSAGYTPQARGQMSGELPEIRSARRYLEEVSQRFFPAGATCKVIAAIDPVAAIVDYARDEKVDLIAIATHGRTGQSRALLGSVAGSLLRSRVAPLFLTHPQGLGRAAPANHAITPAEEPKSWLPSIGAYPKTTLLRNGSTVTLRPLEEGDELLLFQFFQRIPEEDRYYLKEDVTRQEVVHAWTTRIDFERAIPIVAVTDGKIVADATLHRSRSLARRHIGEYAW